MNEQINLSENQNKKKKLFFSIIVLVVIIVGVALAFILSTEKEDNENKITTTTTQKVKDNIGEQIFTFADSNSKLKVVYKSEKVEKDEDNVWEYAFYAEVYINDKLVTTKKHIVDYSDELPTDYTKVEFANIVTKEDVTLVNTDKEYFIVQIYTASPTYVPGRALLVLSETGKTIEYIDLSITEYVFSNQNDAKRYGENKYYYKDKVLNYLEYDSSDKVKEIRCEINDDKVLPFQTNYLYVEEIMNES